MRDFTADGFTVIRGILNVDELAGVLRSVQEIPRSAYRPIFLDIQRDQMVEFRLQTKLDLRSTLAFRRLIAALVTEFDSRWVVKELSVLLSLPGGAVQAVHRDVPVEDVTWARLKTGSMPGGLFVALMADTSVRMYRGCFAEADEERAVDVVVQPDDIVLFRGDVAHCGLRYSAVNFRLHAFLAVRGTQIRVDATEAVLFNEYSCRWCGSKSRKKKTIQNHERRCHGNPSLGDARKRTRELDHVSTRCDSCGDVLPSRSASRQHKLRHVRGEVA